MKPLVFLAHYRDCLRQQLPHDHRRADWALEQLRELIEGPAGKDGHRPPLPASSSAAPSR